MTFAPQLSFCEYHLVERFQVIIVGGGPVGVALAVELGLRGITCALIERRPGLSNIPKGQNLMPRTLEHFYFWGIADELRAARVMPKGYPISGITAYGTLMSDYWYPPPQREQVRKYYFQDVERLPQYATERVLRERMAQLPSVTNLFGWTAETIAQDAAGVRVTISENAGERRETLEADYLVGCDGSHSLVRTQAGIGRGGVDFDETMVLAVFRSKELHEALKRFPDRATFNVLHPDLKGYWQFFGRVDVGEQFFFHAPVPANTTKDNYDFLGLLQRVAGFEFHAEFDYVGFWDLRVSVADTYQVGRVLIAGDAAHSHPPYGGFGLNNGLEDAKNLGWKLAAELQGWGGDALIRSYSDERRPIFQETGQDFIAARIDSDAAWLEAHNPERDLADFEAAWAARKARSGGSVLSYEPNYEGSPVVAGPSGGKSSAHGTHSFAARAGHHLAPQPLSSGTNVFEELGSGFTLLAFGADDASVDAFEQAAAAAALPLTVVRDRFAGGREAYEHRLMLVRPDQYIAWTADAAPADTAALLAQVTGRQPQTGNANG
jgi:2-polyprenyl-6-methoxyphenol hydroxylase-like FAD-dependent oxidoreductase